MYYAVFFISEYRNLYTVYNDYYFQIIIEVAQLRQHKQRLDDLRTQLGGWNLEFIDITIYYYIAPMKPKHNRKS